MAYKNQKKNKAHNKALRVFTGDQSLKRKRKKVKRDVKLSVSFIKRIMSVTK